MVTTTTSAPTEVSPDRSERWYLKDLPKYLAALAGILVMYVAISLYQFEYGITTGLDFTDPLFQAYWMRLFYIEVVFVIATAIAIWSYLWRTRTRDFDSL